MEIVFVKSKWEMWHDPLEPFLVRATADGFSATEIFLATEQAPADEIAAMHREHGLALVGQILTQGATPDDHVRSLDVQFEFALGCEPILINHHAGRDIFSFDDNLRVLRRIVALGREHGVPVVVETHRGRATFAATTTRRILETLAELRLTADFSHWMVVHESTLEDQEETLELAMARSDHIHARVGYEEGPQVTDPRAPEWERHVRRHLELWRRIVEQRRRQGSERLTITPEFGPPGYMHTIPFTNEPVRDAWEINVYMKEFLADALTAAEPDTPSG
jgi:sugar phosphate isomerase/epimerase